MLCFVLMVKARKPMTMTMTTAFHRGASFVCFVPASLQGRVEIEMQVAGYSHTAHL